ncbi:hypothetical protein DFH11DRAFT_1728861 [Phellopilus nigrolimitatus]|nr:hypothetical protein DFH11DRAFT_1728861 [Phellopilus nigrolimitatus]
MHDIGILALERLLACVKEQGYLINPDELMAVDGPFIPTLIPDLSNVPQIMDILRTLKALNSSLSALSRVVKEGLPRVQSHLLPIVYSRRGLPSLPEELIAQVFEMAYADDGNVSWHLSLVSRRFRRIALSLPRLWTKLDTSHDPELNLERSRGHGISLDICTNLYHVFTEERFHEFMRKVGPHSDRWKSVRLSGHWDEAKYSRSDVLVKSLRDNFAGKTFPVLETLCSDYEFNCAEVMDDNALEIWQDAKNFFSEWDMPALRVLKTTNLIPSLNTSSLTRFQLSLDGLSENEEEYIIYDLGALTNFLRALSSLEELSFVLRNINSFSQEQISDVDMINLNVLRFDIEFCKAAPVRNLIKVLLAPNVTEMSIRIFQETHHDLSSMLASFFQRGQYYWPLLKSLHLDIACNTEKYSLLQFALWKLHKLEHLSLNVQDSNHPMWSWPPNQPCCMPIRSLRIDSCENFNTTLIEELMPIIQRPEFESLEILECPGMIREVVEKMVPSDKTIIWKDYN